MTIAIVGAGGQLGHAFVKALPDVPALKRSDLDITEEATVRNVLTRLSPDVVRHQLCRLYRRRRRREQPGSRSP